MILLKNIKEREKMKFYAFGVYSEESFAGFIQNPGQDRRAVAENLVNKMGLKMLGFDFLRGDFDFIVSCEAENFEQVAGLKMAFEASGAGSMVILEAIDMNSIAKIASEASTNYLPPSETN
ncbi:MAG: hypothetical protein CL903_04165 [Dehalococcoidia bacterium]|nr:hypothetical protein [Dehalococcoidia bacterium]